MYSIFKPSFLISELITVMTRSHFIEAIIGFEQGRSFQSLFMFFFTDIVH